MAQSKTIKDQASSAKRTATSIRNIVEQLDWEKVKDKSKGISQADRDILIKAASILGKLGSVKSGVAKKVKSAEIAEEKAIKLAEAEAKNIISNWKGAESNLEKVALIIGGKLDYSLMTYLKDGLPVWNREVTSDDWLKMLDELVRDALNAIPAHCAFHAVTNDKPISDVMLVAQEKLVSIKNHPKAIFLAKEWAAKINP